MDELRLDCHKYIIENLHRIEKLFVCGSNYIFPSDQPKTKWRINIPNNYHKLSPGNRKVKT